MKEAAKAGYLQSYEAQKAFQTALITSISQNYYILLMLDEQLEVAKKNYNFRDSTLKMVELQFVSGEVTSLAVQQTRSQVLVAASLVPQLERRIAVHENELMLLTGRLPQRINRNNTLSAVRMDNSSLDSVPLYFVQNRPDVLHAEYHLK